MPLSLASLHGSEDGIGVFLAGAGSVGIFDAQAELTAEVAGKKPAENGGTAAADMEMAGGAGGESRDDLFHCRHLSAFM